MSWKGCRCRRRRHARALQRVHFCCLSPDKYATGIQAGYFFPESLVALPGDDEGEEVFDLRKVRSMEKSSGARCDLETCFWKTVV